MGVLNCGPIHSQGLLPFTRPSIPDMAEMQFIRDVGIIIYFLKERKKGGGGWRKGVEEASRCRRVDFPIDYSIHSPVQSGGLGCEC